MSEYSKGDYLRATAIGDDGKEANDIRMLKGPNTTIENVRVDVVQLHISALDTSNHFVKGLAETDCSLQQRRRRRRPAPHLRPGPAQPFREGPRRDRLLDSGGRPAAEDHRLRGGREAA